MISMQYSCNDSVVIVIEKDFDAHAVTDLRTQFEELVNELHCDVVVDLAGVDFIDSSGIGSLVFLYKRLKADNRNLCLLGVHGQPAKLMSMLHIDKTIECYDTIKEYINQYPGMARASA